MVPTGGDGSGIEVDWGRQRKIAPRLTLSVKCEMEWLASFNQLPLEPRRLDDLAGIVFV